MADRIIDIAFYVLNRAWTICATLLVIAAIGSTAALCAPVSHPERVVISLK
ncbi:MAG: hypothetical protein WDN76_11220 [Alphaproteobacteria bacterium]